MNKGSKSIMKRIVMSVIAAAALAGLSNTSNAAVIASFGTAENFTYTTGSSFNLNDTHLLSFGYDSGSAFYSSLPVELQALSISAKLVFWNADADFGAAAVSPPATVLQPLLNIAFEFVNANAMMIGASNYAAGSINLLSGTADSGILSVVVNTSGNGGAVTYAANSFDNLIFTADFVPGLENYIDTAYSITGNAKNKSIVKNMFLYNSLNSQGNLSVKLNGNFSADPIVPEPGAVALMLGAGITGGGLLVRRRNK